MAQGQNLKINTSLNLISMAIKEILISSIRFLNTSLKLIAMAIKEMINRFNTLPQIIIS